MGWILCVSASLDILFIVNYKSFVFFDTKFDKIVLFKFFPKYKKI